ncbi:RNA-binding protein 7 [Halotydeus destructor]|nr:RNA-binding protein 7 [Halotydeus destructor]
MAFLRPSSSDSDLSRRPRPGPSADLQLRTLRVTQFSRKVTKDLLYELFIQVGPVRNVVFKPDHAFVEFEHEDSVGYALAMMDGVQLFGESMYLEPKISSQDAFKYQVALQSYSEMQQQSAPPAQANPPFINERYEDSRRNDRQTFRDDRYPEYQSSDRYRRQSDHGLDYGSRGRNDRGGYYDDRRYDEGRSYWRGHDQRSETNYSRRSDSYREKPYDRNPPERYYRR